MTPPPLDRPTPRCQRCLADAEPGRSLCEFHLEYCRQWWTRRRQELARAGACHWGGGCNNATHGYLYCPKHRALMATYKRRYRRKAKQARSCKG